METKRFLNKNICKLLKIIVLLLLFFVCCNKKYDYRTAYIYDTEFVHMGSGYYKLTIFYNFEYNDSIYKGSTKTPGTYRIYGRKKFRENDSIFIKFSRNKPEKNGLANYKVKRIQ